MYSKVILFIFLSILINAVLADDQPFSENDSLLKINRRVKRQHWTNTMQNDMHAAQVQPNIVPPINVFCEPEIPNIGKRSIQPIDSFPNLNSFFLNEETKDVTFVVNGTKLPAHKFVLRAKSTKFDEMFKQDPTKVEFELDHQSEEKFKVLLKYFYTERFALEDESDYRKAIDIYEMAQQYSVDGLKVQIERSLAKMITFNNYLDIYKFADENQMHELIRLWMTFVFANSQQIITDESFMNETVQIAEKVLLSLNAAPSYVLMQIKKLIEANPDLDVQQFRNVVHIERCSVEDLVTLAEMKLFDEKFLFEDMIKRYRVLAANCIQMSNNRHVVRNSLHQHWAQPVVHHNK